MAVSLSVIAAKDSAGTAIAGGLQAQDKSGTGAGPFTLGQVLIDGVAGVNMASVTAANAVKVDGSAVTQPVSIATAPVLVAGAAIIGKVGVDQTTDGTTNKVAADVRFAGTAAATGAGTTTAATQRVVLANDSVLPSGLALPGSSAPVVIAPQTTDVAVTPTVTASSAYTAGNIVGGLMTFASVLPSVGNNGVLQSITVKFKDTAVTGNVNVHVFKDTTLSGTYADKTAGTWNTADAAKLIGTYQLPTPYSKLGTMTTYNLDGIGKALVAAGTSLYVLVTVDGTPTFASTSSMTVQLSVLPG